MKIAVIIPTIHKGLLSELLVCIRRNTIQPQQMHILADDAGVNEKWNYAIATLDKGVDLVAFLNDDILIKPWFFEAIVQVFKKYLYITTVSPITTHDKDLFETYGRGEPDLHPVGKPQGWAFVMRKTALDQMPPIPAELKTFFGDNWLGLGGQKFGHKWVIDRGNVIYHAIGMTVRKMNLRQSLHDEEWPIYRDLKKEFLASA